MVESRRQDVVPRLYLVADRGYLATDRAWLERLTAVAEAAGGYSDLAFQLRAKTLKGSRRSELLSKGLEIARRGDAPVYLNGLAEEARDLGFDGAHWPEASIPEGRPAGLPRSFRLAASAHSLPSIQRARMAGAQFALFGPIFDPGSKDGRGIGVELLSQMVELSPLPVLAIGGITPARVPACLNAGAAGVAVVSAVFEPALDASEALAAFFSAL